MNYLQRLSAYEEYLVAETVRSGQEQTIELPPPVDDSAADAKDLKIIQAKEVKMVAKRCLKLAKSLMKGYTTVYNQCLQEVKDKLEAVDN